MWRIFFPGLLATLLANACIGQAAVGISCSAPVDGMVQGGAPAVPIPEYEPVRFQVSLPGEFSSPAKFDLSVSLADGWITVRPHRAAYKPSSSVDGQLQPTPPFQEVQLPGLPAGTYKLRVEDGEGRAPGAAGTLGCRQFKVASTGTAVRAQTLVQGDLLRYFLTASQADVDALLALTPNRAEWAFPLWQRTEPGFWVWPVAGDWPATTKPVCRLFNSKASSHFYSANSNDCATLANLPDWREEGIAFRALVPEGGVCGFGTVPVYRLFNTARSNHRFTTNAETYRYAQGKDGWVGEGVAFCSPPV